MSRKLPGSAIVPGTITVTQITGGLNDTTNASYAQANTARTTANDAYGQANTARDQANTARTQANTAYDQANNARGQANTAYGQANAAYDQANASYNVANTKLASAGGTLSGDLIITGNLTVSGNSTTLNTEILTVEDAEVVLLSNVASTPALNAGVIVNRGTSANTFLRWDEALDEWGWSDSGNTTYYFEDLRAGLSTTNTTFGTVNTSLGTINTSYQAAYAQANTARNTANSAYGQANTATTNAGNAYDTANSAFTASSRLRTDDTRTIAPSTHTAGRLTFGFTSYTNNGNASTYADYLHFRSYTDSSGGSDNLVMFHKSGIGMRIWQQTWNSANAYSNYVDVLHSSNYSSYAVPLSGGTMTGTLVVNASTAEIYARSSGGANGQILADGSNLYVGPVGAHGLRLQTNGTTRILIDSSGNVGIGITDPAYKLHVRDATNTGNIAIGSALYPGVIYSSAASGEFRIDNRASSSAGYITFFPNGQQNSIGTEAMRIDTNGHVCVGTTTPDNTEGWHRVIEGKGANHSKIITTTTNGSVHTGMWSHSSGFYGAPAGGIAGTFSNHPYSLITNKTTRLTIDSSGNMYLGLTGNPSGWGSAIKYAIRQASASGYTGFVAFASGNDNGIAVGHDGTKGVVGVSYATGSYTPLTFQTGGTDRITIATDGNVGIGTTSPSNKLHVNGEIRCVSDNAGRAVYVRASSTNAGNILQFEETDGSQIWEIVGRGYGAGQPFYIYKTSGTGNGYKYIIDSSGNHTFNGNMTISGTLTESSSMLIKENIDPITNALDIVTKLVGVTYDRKDGTGKNRAGLIAEEVEQVLPNVVNKDEEGNPTGIQYTNLIAYLIESIKELKAEIDVLKSK